MRVVRHLAGRDEARRRVVLTLGNFDGVHLGHQAILERTVREAAAREVEAVVVTFEPHPVAVLAPDRAPRRLQTLRDRLRCFRDAGIDLVALQRFTRAFSRRTAEDFVAHFLAGHFVIEHVVVGHRVSFGRGRAGDAATLTRFGRRLGFDVDSIGPVRVEGEEVSSTAVRAALLAGDVRRAARFLGRPWSTRGRVVVGARRGRALGFPTANVHTRRALVRPPDGVYAARVGCEGRVHDAVLNLGMRPTFDASTRALEVHLLDFDDDLYGRWLDVQFMEHLRGEQRFTTGDELRAAIARDVSQARKALTGGGRGPGA